MVPATELITGLVAAREGRCGVRDERHHSPDRWRARRRDPGQHLRLVLRDAHRVVAARSARVIDRGRAELGGSGAGDRR